MNNIFTYNSDINKNAYLNWRTHQYDPINNMIVIAEGFMSSAITLTQNCLDDNHDKKADMLIFPIMFNVNHSIEVYLKAISWCFNQLLNKDNTFEPSHNLRSLFINTKKLAIEFNTDYENLELFSKLDQYINELYNKIETVKDNGKKVYDITFARYSLTKHLEPQFYITEFKNVVIDLDNFIVFFTDISNKLASISSHLIYLIDEKKEMEAELP